MGRSWVPGAPASRGQLLRYVLYAVTILLMGSVIVKARLTAQSHLSAFEHTPTTLPEGSVVSIKPGWRLIPKIKTADAPNSILISPKEFPSYSFVSIGLSGLGAIQWYHPEFPHEIGYFATGLGDRPQYVTCNINRIAMTDLDHDGTPELLATTSQVLPLGRPRLYAWSGPRTNVTSVAMARANIESSWSHSIGVLPRPGSRSDSVFVTYCGHGEIVEYRLDSTESLTGFHRDTLSWKQVGQTPASGEWLQVADADNDGTPDICVATGYAFGQAALLLYSSAAAGAKLQVKHRIDEDKRFGNVRFLVVTPRDGAESQIYAWWCSDLAGGNAEFIRYRLGSDGVRERVVIARGTAGDLWPDDNQFTVSDLDGDQQREVWFGTHGGSLWSLKTEPGATPELIVKFKGGVGPLASGTPTLARQEQLFMGWDNYILALEADPAH